MIALARIYIYHLGVKIEPVDYPGVQEWWSTIGVPSEFPTSSLGFI